MRAQKNLTDSRIAALKSKAERYEIWQPNGGGFGVRVTPKGVKSFVLMYRFEGALKRLTLGNYPKMSLADAGVALSKARQMLEKGEDPGKSAQEEKEAERTAETVDQLCDDYLERHAKPNKRSADGDERMINREILPHWKGRKAKDIARRDIVKRLDAIVDRGSPVMANRFHSLVSRLFNFAVERGVVDHSPVHGVKKPYKETPRDRNLSIEEIVAGWNALDRSTMELNLRRATRLALITLQRRDEVLRLHEGQIDRVEQLWTIPPGSITRKGSKNARPHVVPLSKMALDIIGDPPKRDDKADKDAPLWIFPSPRTKGPYRGASLDHSVRDLFIPRDRNKKRNGAKLSKGEHVAPAPLPPLANADLLAKRAALEAAGKREGDPEFDEITAKIDAERWTPHDLRRTGSTKMREIDPRKYGDNGPKITRDDLKLVLNHADQSVTGKVYDKYEGLDEKRRALDLWALHLSKILKEQPSDERASSDVEEGHHATA